MSDHEVKMIILSTDDLDESIRFYSETLGMTGEVPRRNPFRRPGRRTGDPRAGDRHRSSIPGRVVVGIKTADVDAAAKAIGPAAAGS